MIIGIVATKLLTYSAKQCTQNYQNLHLIHWIKFFLVAVKETAEKGKATFQEIMALRREVDAFVTNLGSRAPRAGILFNRLYKRPIINANDTAELLGVSHQTASTLIRDLESNGFLTETTRYQRNRNFMFRITKVECI